MKQLESTSAFLLGILLCGLSFATDDIPSPDNCAAAKPSPAPCCCKPEPPELWVINSRCAPKCDGLEEGFERITYQRYDPAACRFISETRESFLAAQQDIPTILFSHGNRLTHQEAMENCWNLYERFKICPGRKLLVFWSWPSEIYYTRPILRPLSLIQANIKIKYIFAERQGYYIAKLANMMSTSRPLTLSGHSYGGLTVVAAMHFLGGGSLDGLSFAEGAQIERKNLRGAVISGAFDCDFLYPGYRYDKALYAVDQFYTTYNTKDSALKFWPNYSFRGQEAIGYVGICPDRLCENTYKVRQDRLTEDVGKSHYVKAHLASCKMTGALCEMAFETGACCDPDSSGNNLLRRGGVNVEQLMDRPATILFPGLGL